MKTIIGVDFDNTIISYDDLMYNIAREQKLVASHVKKQKKQIRDSIRLLPEGEKTWQQLQAKVYGPEIEKAQLIKGVEGFFQNCYQAGITVYIVSHKTHYASCDETKTNLREASLNWMTEHRFFEVAHLGLDRNQVFFESTRSEKVARIHDLGCTHFIDDLEETFMENSFPRNVEKMLYTPCDSHSTLSGITRFTDWKEIHDYFFITKN